MSEDEIERELVESQEAFAAFAEIRARRQRAVMAAREAKWSKYKIAATMGVKGPTVDSIIDAAEREAAK